MSELNHDNEEPKLELGPQRWVSCYGRPKPCGECGGSGRIILLTSAQPCAACEGEGEIWPEPVVEHTPPKLGYWHTDRKFDDQGRLIQETTWFEPVEDAK